MTALLCAVQHLHAQQPSFIASVSGKRVVQNGVFDIEFELKDAQGSNFVPPSFSDFRVVGGPSRGSRTTIINGQMNSSESWSYSLLATKKGKFTIGPASVNAGSKKLTTQPIVIEVVEGRDLAEIEKDAGSNGQILLVAEIEKKDYYPGQQIILNYRILTSQNIQTIDVISEDDYAEFFVQSFEQFDKQPSMVKINGVDYTSRILKSIALFPHQSGTYEIDPLVMLVGINAPFSGIQGFFTMRRMEEVHVATDPVRIQVLPLPGGAPESFKGAVGKYSLTSTASKSELTTDESFSLQLEITGNGDPKRWDPPAAPVDTAFEVYDPKILENKQVEVNGIFQNTRVIEYQLLPAHEGQYTVFIPFTYFDPDLKKYVTISSDTAVVQVALGRLNKRGIAIDDESADSRFTIKPVSRPLFKDAFWLSWPHLILFGLILSGSAFGIWKRAEERRLGKVSHEERIRSAAGRKAAHALEILQQQSETFSDRSFFEKATEIYYAFLSERLLIPPSELDENSLPKYLHKAKVDRQTAERAVQLFKMGLPLRYGGIPSGISRDEFLSESRFIVNHV